MTDRPRYGLADAAAAAKPRDAWFTVLVADRAAIRLTRHLANHTPVTPTQITAAWGLLYAAAAGAFLFGGGGWPMLGAGLFLLGFLLDCVDGKLAWLTGRTSRSGAWLGAVLGRLGFVVCALALLLGRYARDPRDTELILALIVVSAELVRQVLERFRPPARPVPLERVRFGRWRGRLARYGLRGRPVSEVEFMLAVCVLAPLTGWYVPLIGISAGLMLLFELVAAFDPWLATPDERGQSGPIEVVLPMAMVQE